MPVCLRRGYESYSAECPVQSELVLARPGDDQESNHIPKFMGQIVEALQVVEDEAEKLRPMGLNEDLILESSLLSLFVTEAVKQAWFTSVKSSMETLPERISKSKVHVGISPIYDSAYTTRESQGAKYKPVARKINPVSTQDPDAPILVYRDIQITNLPELPRVPTKMEDLKFGERLTTERVSSIISRIPAGFLTKSEVELLIDIMMQYEKAIAFTDLERGTFSRNYYPDYVIQTVLHQPWQRKPIRLPQSQREEVIKIMKEQMASGKYKPSSASYHSTFFAVEKKGSSLRA